MVDYVRKLVNSVERTKSRVIQQSRQRRGGVTDLYSIDYVSKVGNPLKAVTSITAVEDGNGTPRLDETTRVKALTRALKNAVPNATINGITGIIGYFGRESGVLAKVYEADYATNYQYNKIAKEPTVENLVGSWSAFESLYGISLYENGYLVDGKHYLGIGLGMWTGGRAKALWEYAKANNIDLMAYSTQIKYMMIEPNYSDIFIKWVTSNASVEAITEGFLAEWGGVPGNALAERIAFANKHKANVTEEFNLANPDEFDLDGTSANNPNGAVTTETQTISQGVKGGASYRILIPSDLDRFQRWFLKFLVEFENAEDKQRVADVRLSVTAQNQTTGKSLEIDLTEIFRRQWACDWIGDSETGEGVFPNEKPNEGYDLMYSAWYLNNEQREALFSAGEKIFHINAIGNAKITLRNFLKFSHIN